MRERKVRSQFPRNGELPSQSSKYWAKEKDRYLRQLLISDIEQETGRELVVYFARLDQPIIETDSDDVSEIFEGVESKDIDLLIHTPGGLVDAVEKFVTVLRNRTNDYRVIVPSWAKSGGTVIALSSSKILLGINSELGPIDPQMGTPDFGPVPAEFISEDETQPHILRKMAETNVKRAQALAEKYLRDGMLKRKKVAEVRRVVKKISSAQSYGSHGAVIDHTEAESLGLSVEYLDPSSSLWRRIWLLYCLYDYDVRQRNLGKFFEGALYSIMRKPLSF
jgi:ClpP class serine protease